MTIELVNTPTAADSLPTILYDNKFAVGTLTASSEATDYPKENVRDEGTVKQWQPTSLPANIKNDYGSATAVDCAAIIAHDLGSKGCTVLVESSTDDISYTTRATIVPTDNSTILALFTSVMARYWRISITGAGDEPFIGVIMVGERFNFPGGVKAPYTPAWLARDYELLTANTIGGQFIGNRVFRQGGSTKIDLVSVSRSFGENDILPFMLHYNIGKAFVWAAGPAVFDKDVAYVWRKENAILAPVFDNDGNWMAVGMEVYIYGE
jgi:hypothetical protein